MAGGGAGGGDEVERVQWEEFDWDEEKGSNAGGGGE